MPIVKLNSGWDTPRLLKVHMRKKGGSGLSLCGLKGPDGEATDEPEKVTCERCISIMKTQR
jgi:hypothetical protein